MYKLLLQLLKVLDFSLPLFCDFSSRWGSLRLRPEVTGVVQANSRLSGIPDLTLTFVDPNVIDDCSFHPCVRYNRFERDSAVSFVPPDGKFDLMKYRVTEGISLPFKLMPLVKGEFLLFSDNLHKLNLFFF